MGDTRHRALRAESARCRQVGRAAACALVDGLDHFVGGAREVAHLQAARSHVPFTAAFTAWRTPPKFCVMFEATPRLRRRPHLDDDHSAQASPRDGWGRRSTNITRPAQDPRISHPATMNGAPSSPARINPGRDPEFWPEPIAAHRRRRVAAAYHRRSRHITGLAAHGDARTARHLDGHAHRRVDAARAPRRAAPPAATARSGRRPPPPRRRRRGSRRAPGGRRCGCSHAPRCDSASTLSRRRRALGGAISERRAAPLRRSYASRGPRAATLARLVAADVPPIDALDDFVRRKDSARTGCARRSATTSSGCSTSTI